MGSYLSESQIQQLSWDLGKEKAITNTIDGYRFEHILCNILENCELAVNIDPKKVTKTRDKKWFDLKQNGNGIEVKTFQVSSSSVGPGSYVNNVLKRIPPEALPDELSVHVGTRKEIDKNADPAEVGRAIIEYINKTKAAHAIEKGISGEHYLSVLLRNKDFTQVAYWQEPFDLGDYSDYQWRWKDASLEASKNDKVILSWYALNQRQLFYHFEVPEDADCFQIPVLKCIVVEELELESLIREASEEGFESTFRRIRSMFSE